MTARDSNGYLIVKVGNRKFYITPYDAYYAVRNVHGSIERVDNKQLIFRTEQDAVAHLGAK